METDFKAVLNLGAWAALSVKHLTLGFSSYCDLRVMRLNPGWGSVLSVDSAGDSCSLCRLPNLCSLNQSINLKNIYIGLGWKSISEQFSILAV